MSKVSDIQNVNPQMLLAELWENAAVNPHAFEVLEKSLKKTIRLKKDTFTHIPENYYELTTMRNRQLITHEEQDILRDKVVAFFGLSVGSNAATTWMLLSRAKVLKLLDPDIISPTNLNRIQFGWQEIGKRKVDAVKERLLDINPYANIITSTDASFKNVEKLLMTKPIPTIIVDEIDDLESKLVLRKFAKSHKLPLVSAADVGDNVMIDIERYDLNPSLPLFLGRVPNIDKLDFSNMSDIDRKKLIIKLIGFEQMSEKLLDSLLHIGKSVVSWPQLGSTAVMAGGVVATTMKKIILGENVKSGRYYVSLDNILVTDYFSAARKIDREKKVEIVKEKLRLT